MRCVFGKRPIQTETHTHILGTGSLDLRRKLLLRYKSLQGKCPAIGQHACVALQLYTARYPWGPGNDYRFDQE